MTAFIAVLTTAHRFVLFFSGQSNPHYNTECLPDISTTLLYEDISSYLEENTLGSKEFLLTESLTLYIIGPGRKT